MNRRTFLAVGGTAALGGVAGCLGGNGGTPANEYGYETTTTDGTEVPLAPVDDVYQWYENDEAKFADARGRDQYEAVHIAGAVFSPAPNGTENDPAEEWSTDTQIVTYCACPHHLSTMRAAALIDAGYERTYAIDEGLNAWIDRGYPIEGANVSANRSTYAIQGQSDAAHAGEMVMLEQLDADRREAAPIADDGSYTLQLHYAGSTDSRFRVEAPDYTVEGTLEELTSTTVTA
ncbi:rhodanese-like domain-containing protein [Natrinema sp. 1APR25-10V2]|uniref:rhodanese-like domain-containing protein n=1 Tax=Natrinema sp. 1APR25-10V2 TaxID=2951081 RepID=UPI002875B9A3|nr:rhodanese-like domain-containing protein [Natrinema sp. 1APR25-10V2]MDS0476135.1 rhodanese-like domain-containing protein [Natrinema sp. 1APR25-10V2]